MVEKTPREHALPVRPMNRERPIDYPTAALSSLSDDARVLHRRGGHKLDRDVFNEKMRNRYVSEEDARDFRPTERMLAAIAELEAAGLARYDAGYRSFYKTEVCDEYTYATGRGSQLIKVSTFVDYPGEAKLLAVLIGADFEGRQGPAGTEISIRSRHEDATDVEHDASSTALLTVRNISAPDFTGYGRMTFSGVLTKVHLYPIGTDPLVVDDGDTRPGAVCTDCEKPHPFAPFLPPEIESLKGPQFVTVEALPLRPYLVAAPPLNTSSHN